MQASDIPVLSGDQVAMVCADAATGIVLTTSGQRFLGAGHRYTIFPSVAAAVQGATDFIGSYPGSECWLINSFGTTFRRITATTDQ